MTWYWVVVDIVLAGMLFGAALLHADGPAGPANPFAPTGSPSYAIPLKDGGTVVVWWDAVSDPTKPGWRCEVPGQRGAGTGRTIIPLAAPPGDWQAALAEAKALLKGRFAESE